MVTLTLTIPFTSTFEYDADAVVEIPISTGEFHIVNDLRQNAPAARYDSKTSVVRTTLSLAGATYAYLKSFHGPESPRLVVDVASSSAAHTAFNAAATGAADSAAPTGLVTDAIRFVGTTRVEQDLESRDPFACVTWAGELEVTWVTSTAQHHTME